MNKFLILFLALTLISCKNETQEKITATSETTDTIKSDFVSPKEKIDSKNKVVIDFNKNKELLDIIILLPDSIFSSWEWKLNDRIKWYNEIKTNNYYIDNDTRFFNLKYFKPTEAKFSIVDGFWSINIYKTEENSYIVATDDITGNGSNLHLCEVKANKIKKYFNENQMFSDIEELLKKKNTTVDCNEKFEELEMPLFNYDFSNKNKIEIESSWYLKKDEYNDCFNGNSILYNFNPKTKKFEIEKVYWKPKQNN